MVAKVVPVNAHLLDRVEYPAKKRPLMIDKVPASTDPDAGPFLITSSKSLLWVERAFDAGFLRVAVREDHLDPLYRSIIEEIAMQGVAREWGNVHPPSKDGVLAAIAHISYYGIPDPVLLYGSEFDIGMAPDLPRVPVDWLPPTWGVVIPDDRSFVGTAYVFGGGHLGAVVHNPSRGVCVVRGPA